MTGPAWPHQAHRTDVVYGSLVLLAASLTLAFWLGDMARPSVHDVRTLLAALVVNLLATVVKLGDRTHAGAVQLAASLVADLQLLAAAVVWLLRGDGGARVVTPQVVSLSAGALLACLTSVLLLIGQLVVTSARDR